MPTAISPAILNDPWFAGVPLADREALLAAAEPVALPAGAMLFRRGDPVLPPHGCFYALAEGVMKFSTLQADGRESILAVLERGHWFGEISLIDGSPRTHDATALIPCKLLAVPMSVFAERMQGAGFANAVAALLAARVRSLYGLMEDTTPRGLRARVARRLLSLAHGDGSATAALRSSVVMPQEVLAMMLGISRQTLSKELKALAGMGAISQGYGRIEILSARVLEHLVA